VADLPGKKGENFTTSVSPELGTASVIWDTPEWFPPSTRLISTELSLVFFLFDLEALWGKPPPSCETASISARRERRTLPQYPLHQGGTDAHEAEMFPRQTQP
jgi:hypothetical protein